MIGQQNVIQKINSYSLSTLPHSMLIVGDVGSEQLEICEYIANKFNFETKDLTDNISFDTINEISTSRILELFIIDVAKITEREQNILLKLYEEPNEYTYIILLSTSDSLVLDTLKTRSYTIKLATYTRDQLSKLTKSQIALNVCKTPGQIEIANHTDMDKLYELVSKMVNSMVNASLPNALTISDKINFSDEYDKFDFYMFIKMFRYVLLQNNMIQLYRRLLDFDTKVWSMNSKKMYFDNFLLDLWLSMRYDN